LAGKVSKESIPIALTQERKGGPSPRFWWILFGDLFHLRRAQIVKVKLVGAVFATAVGEIGNTTLLY